MSTQTRALIRNGTLLLAILAALSLLLWLRSAPVAAAAAVVVPAAATVSSETTSEPRTAVLAGGCFWGVEAVFEHVDGVLDVVSGYAGGDARTAHYRAVSSGRTRQAEAVQITYDPAKVRYSDLLQIYFSVAHDPTQVNRQGPDIGPQYRSEIFAVDADQARVARTYIEQIDKAEVFDAPVATRISRLERFYPASAYHQNYATRHPNSPYIRYHDAPKVEALKQRFAQRYRERPARLAQNR